MKFKYLKIFSLALLFSFFISSDTFAASDIVFTFEDSTTYPVTLCGSSDSCSSYKYVYTTCSTPPVFTVYDTVDVSISYLPNGSGSSNFRLYFNPSSIFTFPSSSLYLTSFSLRSPSNPSSLIASGCTLTLSENFPSSSAPSGSLSITENGTYDVSSYAEAVVDVPDTVIYGDYHDDLVNIYHAILVCAGVCLVLYFFYCIYRMIIKSSGGH